MSVTSQAKLEAFNSPQSTDRDGEVSRDSNENGRVELECQVCGVHYEVRPSRSDSKYCSQECTGKAQRRRVKKECGHCGQNFEVPKSQNGQRFCSRPCADSAGAIRPNKGRVVIECASCGEEFDVAPSMRGRKHCSRECAGKGEINFEIDCEVCSETFTVHEQQRAENARFCSWECKNKWQAESYSGKGNPQWRGGYELQHGPGWVAARRKALERDGYQCVMCGIDREGHKELTGKDLHVHHKIPFRKFESYKEANQLDNLITVCRSCHIQLEPVSQELEVGG